MNLFPGGVPAWVWKPTLQPVWTGCYETAVSTDGFAFGAGRVGARSWKFCRFVGRQNLRTRLGSHRRCHFAATEHIDDPFQVVSHDSESDLDRSSVDPA